MTIPTIENDNNDRRNSWLVFAVIGVIIAAFVATMLQYGSWTRSEVDAARSELAAVEAENEELRVMLALVEEDRDNLLADRLQLLPQRLPLEGFVGVEITRPRYPTSIDVGTCNDEVADEIFGQVRSILGMDLLSTHGGDHEFGIAFPHGTGDDQVREAAATLVEVRDELCANAIEAPEGWGQLSG